MIKKTRLYKNDKKGLREAVKGLPLGKTYKSPQSYIKSVSHDVDASIDSKSKNKVVVALESKMDQGRFGPSFITLVRQPNTRWRLEELDDTGDAGFVYGLVKGKPVVWEVPS